MIDPIKNLAQLFPNEEHLVRVKAGGVIYLRGSPGHCGYVIKYGEVDIMLNGKLVEAGAIGCFFGEECLLNTVPRRATVIAASDCGLVPIDRRRLDALVTHTPGLLNHIKRVIELRQDMWDLERGYA